MYLLGAPAEVLWWVELGSIFGTKQYDATWPGTGLKAACSQNTRLASYGISASQSTSSSH